MEWAEANKTASAETRMIVFLGTVVKKSIWEIAAEGHAGGTEPLSKNRAIAFLQSFLGATKL
jgi:hypothetical protein